MNLKLSHLDLQEKRRSLTLEQVEKKWKNLLQGYKKFIENMNTTGKARMKKPEFFDLIDQIIGDGQVIRPLGLAEEEVLPESPLTCTTQETEEDEPFSALDTDNSTAARLSVPKKKADKTTDVVEEYIRLLVEQNKKALAIDEQKIKITEEHLKTQLQFEREKMRISQQIKEEKLRLQREFLQENLRAQKQFQQEVLAAYKERTNLVSGKNILIEERLKTLETKIDNK